MVSATTPSGYPPGWEADYDGDTERWFYVHRPTGVRSYHFPKAGDEMELANALIRVNTTLERPKPKDLHPEEDKKDAKASPLIISSNIASVSHIPDTVHASRHSSTPDDTVRPDRRRQSEIVLPSQRPNDIQQSSSNAISTTSITTPMASTTVQSTMDFIQVSQSHQPASSSMDLSTISLNQTQQRNLLLLCMERTGLTLEAVVALISTEPFVLQNTTSQTFSTTSSTTEHGEHSHRGVATSRMDQNPTSANLFQPTATENLMNVQSSQQNGIGAQMALAQAAQAAHTNLPGPDQPQKTNILQDTLRIILEKTNAVPPSNGNAKRSLNDVSAPIDKPASTVSNSDTGASSVGAQSGQQSLVADSTSILEEPEQMEHIADHTKRTSAPFVPYVGSTQSLPQTQAQGVLSSGIHTSPQAPGRQGSGSSQSIHYQPYHPSTSSHVLDQEQDPRRHSLQSTRPDSSGSRRGSAQSLGPPYQPYHPPQPPAVSPPVQAATVVVEQAVPTEQKQPKVSKPDEEYKSQSNIISATLPSHTATSASTSLQKLESLETDIQPLHPVEALQVQSATVGVDVEFPPLIIIPFKTQEYQSLPQAVEDEAQSAEKGDEKKPDTEQQSQNYTEGKLDNEPDQTVQFESQCNPQKQHQKSESASTHPKPQYHAHHQVHALSHQSHHSSNNHNKKPAHSSQSSTQSSSHSSTASQTPIAVTPQLQPGDQVEQDQTQEDLKVDHEDSYELHAAMSNLIGMDGLIPQMHQASMFPNPTTSQVVQSVIQSVELPTGGETSITATVLKPSQPQGHVESPSNTHHASRPTSISEPIGSPQSATGQHLHTPPASTPSPIKLRPQTTSPVQVHPAQQIRPQTVSPQIVQPRPMAPHANTVLQNQHQHSGSVSSVNSGSGIVQAGNIAGGGWNPSIPLSMQQTAHQNQQQHSVTGMSTAHPVQQTPALSGQQQAAMGQYSAQFNAQHNPTGLLQGSAVSQAHATAGMQFGLQQIGQQPVNQQSMQQGQQNQQTQQGFQQGVQHFQQGQTSGGVVAQAHSHPGFNVQVMQSGGQQFAHQPTLQMNTNTSQITTSGLQSPTQVNHQGQMFQQQQFGAPLQATQTAPNTQIIPTSPFNPQPLQHSTTNPNDSASINSVGSDGKPKLTSRISHGFKGALKPLKNQWQKNPNQTAAIASGITTIAASAFGVQIGAEARIAGNLAAGIQNNANKKKKQEEMKAQHANVAKIQDAKIQAAFEAGKASAQGNVGVQVGGQIVQGQAPVQTTSAVAQTNQTVQIPPGQIQFQQSQLQQGQVQQGQPQQTQQIPNRMSISHAQVGVQQGAMQQNVQRPQGQQGQQVQQTQQIPSKISAAYQQVGGQAVQQQNVQQQNIQQQQHRISVSLASNNIQNMQQSHTQQQQFRPQSAMPHVSQTSISQPQLRPHVPQQGGMQQNIMLQGNIQQQNLLQQQPQQFQNAQQIGVQQGQQRPQSAQVLPAFIPQQTPQQMQQQQFMASQGFRQQGFQPQRPSQPAMNPQALQQRLQQAQQEHQNKLAKLNKQKGEIVKMAAKNKINKQLARIQEQNIQHQIDEQVRKFQTEQQQMLFQLQQAGQPQPQPQVQFQPQGNFQQNQNAMQKPPQGPMQTQMQRPPQNNNMQNVPQQNNSQIKPMLQEALVQQFIQQMNQQQNPPQNPQQQQAAFQQFVAQQNLIQQNLAQQAQLQQQRLSNQNQQYPQPQQQQEPLITKQDIHALVQSVSSSIQQNSNQNSNQTTSHQADNPPLSQHDQEQNGPNYDIMHSVAHDNVSQTTDGQTTQQYTPTSADMPTTPGTSIDQSNPTTVVQQEFNISNNTSQDNSQQVFQQQQFDNNNSTSGTTFQDNSQAFNQQQFNDASNTTFQQPFPDLNQPNQGQSEQYPQFNQQNQQGYGDQNQQGTAQGQTAFTDTLGNSTGVGGTANQQGQVTFDSNAQGQYDITQQQILGGGNSGMDQQGGIAFDPNAQQQFDTVQQQTQSLGDQAGAVGQQGQMTFDPNAQNQYGVGQQQMVSDPNVDVNIVNINIDANQQMNIDNTNTFVDQSAFYNTGTGMDTSMSTGFGSGQFGATENTFSMDQTSNLDMPTYSVDTSSMMANQIGMDSTSSYMDTSSSYIDTQAYNAETSMMANQIAADAIGQGMDNGSSYVDDSMTTTDYTTTDYTTTEVDYSGGDFGGGDDGGWFD